MAWSVPVDQGGLPVSNFTVFTDSGSGTPAACATTADGTCAVAAVTQSNATMSWCTRLVCAARSTVLFGYLTFLAGCLTTVASRLRHRTTIEYRPPTPSALAW